MPHSGKTSLTETLGAFVAATDYAAIPPAIVARAKVSLVHNLAMALAGRKYERHAHAMAKKFWPLPPQATLLYDGARVSMEAAAFANGALMHARSQDDTHAGSTSHPGSATMPAAFAVAEAEGCNGAELLAAIVLGYEVLGRIGRDFDHLVTAKGFRSAAVFGGFGAAAAAAKLLRLSASETAHALGIVAHMCGGLAQVWEEGSPEFPLQLGFAARNGIFAARAAQGGATAARESLVGKSGLFSAYAGVHTPATEALAGLGQSWQFQEVTVKSHPVCAILQGPVDSMLRVCRSNDVDPRAGAEVVLELSPYEATYPGVDNPGPFVSNTAAKMSAQYSLSLAMLDRRLTMDGLFRLTDPAIAAQAARVRVHSDPKLIPRSSRLSLVFADGRTLVAEVGSPVGKPDFDEIVAFAYAMIPEMEVGSAAVDHMIQAVAQLERAPNLHELFDNVMYEKR